MFFASFYVLGIEYGGNTAATMDFMQRCLFSINPDGCSKMSDKKSRRHSVNPKVMALVNKVQDYNTSMMFN